MSKVPVLLLNAMLYIKASAMTNEELLKRITIDPKVCFGKPCIRGHRVWVSLVLDLLARGASRAEILEDYPQLEEADIMACLAYGAEMARERFVEVSIEAKS
jgi:uncharacterized protein (DUF433 family)